MLHTNQGHVKIQCDTQHRKNLALLYSIVETFCKSHNWHFCQDLSIHLDKTKTDKIFFFWIGDMPTLSEWIEFDNALTLHSKRAIAITDSIFDYPEFTSLHLFSCPELLGLYSVFKPPNNKSSDYVPTKLFNCFMHRAESVRQSWFYFLHLNQLIDKGYVSFLLYQLKEYSQLVGPQLFQYIHYTYHLDKLPHFDRAYHELKSQVPFQNFIETGDLDHLIMDSKYALTLEADAPEDDRRSWTFSEKILRAMQYPCYNLLFVRKGGITKLQQLELKINLDYSTIDHESWHQRQQELLNWLIHDPLPINLKYQTDIAEHNQTLLSSWYHKVMSHNHFDEFFTKALEL